VPACVGPDTRIRRYNVKLLHSPLFVLVAVVLLSPVLAGSAAASRPAPGADTVGVYVAPATWFMRELNVPGPADMTFNFGPSTAENWIPVRGDWNGDGMDSQGLYDPLTSAFFLKDVCEPGNADYVFGFGQPEAGWMPIVGDWNGDGVDTVGLYDRKTTTFYLREVNAAGPADHVFNFGASGRAIMPVAGDWDGDGRDTIGLYNAMTGAFFLKNANSGGRADLAFAFGPSAANSASKHAFIAVAGDWNGDGVDTIGVFDPRMGDFFLRDTNTSGPADMYFTFGPAGRLACLPVVGDWNGR
jgi:hypothetical protein